MRKMRRVTALASAVAIVATAAMAAPGGAQTSNPQSRVTELQDAIGEASAEEASALRDLSVVRAQRADLDQAVAALDRQVAAVEQRIGELQGNVDRLTAEASALDERARATARRLDDAKQQASEAAAALYTNEGSSPPLVAVLAVDNLHDVNTGTQYLTHVSEQRREKVASLGELESSIKDLRAAAETQRDQAEADRRDAAAQRDELARLRAEQQAKRDEIADEEAREQSIVASIRARKDEFTNELAALQASSNAITEMLATRQKNQTRATNFHALRPVPGGVTSGFGVRVHPVTGETRMHTGIDLHADQGDPIKAAAGGTVAFAGVRSGYGNTVIIDHGNQYATLYGHASKLLVSTGEKVSAGETIALVGATGLATGPHLHFEVRILGVPVNPAQYL
jgi:murein DD-endopeptidase MepM/ murein hydrolase activator NlpD